MGDGSVENPIVLDEEEDKKNAPPPTTPESFRPTEPPRLERSRDLEQDWKINPIMFLENCFTNYYCVFVLV